MVAPAVLTVAIGAASILVASLFGGRKHYSGRLKQPLNEKKREEEMPLELVCYYIGVNDFVTGACDRLEPYIYSELIGQELAVQQASDAICEHIKEEQPLRPLVLSAHGPPGVGKTLLHLLLARALYNKKPWKNLDCPGQACLGYKVLYGMSYMASERAQQHGLLRAALMEHVKLYPQSLIVIEEYDKLDCPARGLLKQLADLPHSTNITISRSIIILESNTGFPQLHRMLQEAGSREKVNAGVAQRMLKDLLYGMWEQEACERSVDTVKLLSLIQFYLPFLPLERDHIRSLFKMRLKELQNQMLKASRDQLSWTMDVVEFLTSQVDFDGAYPIEGAKEVRALMTRHAVRAVKSQAKARGQEEEARQAAHKASGSKKRLKPAGPQRLQLSVSRDGDSLVCQRLR